MVPSALFAFTAKSYMKLEVCVAIFLAVGLHVLKEVKGDRSSSAGEGDVDNQLELVFSSFPCFVSFFLQTACTSISRTQVFQSEVSHQVDKTEYTGSSSKCNVSACLFLNQTLTEGATDFKVMLLV